MSTLDRYKLLKLLGKGAAGAVYLAEDRLLGGRPVALKRIRAEVDELLRAAFEREFATMASLSLPGVARVFDFGVMQQEGDQQGGPFFTRSFIDGLPLDLAATSGSPVDRVRLVARVANVIVPLHRMGIVHGDIKPGNAIIDPNGKAYVIDFGLSRVVGEQHRKSTGISGTPPFMAPELLRGKVPSIQSDVYALGATLWTILNGEYPFAEFGGGAFSAKLKGERPRLPVESDKVTAAALDVAMRALERDPLDRFPTVEEFIIALDEVAPMQDRRELYPGFVAPRPRGHEAVLSKLEYSIVKTDGIGPGFEKSRVIFIQAPPGGGKSTVLRELKWRLQIRENQIIEIAIREGDIVSPLVMLLQHAMVFAGPESEAVALTTRVRDSISEGRLENTRVSDAIARILSIAGEQGQVVLLVDDLDNAEDVIGAVLRSAIHADTKRGVVVVITGSNENASAITELRPDEVIQIPPLDADSIASLANDILGSVDVSVIEALRAHTHGLPAALVEALASLTTHTVPTEADVMELTLGEAGLAIARSRLRAISQKGLMLLRVLAVIGRPVPKSLAGSMLAALEDSKVDTEQLVASCEDAGLVVAGPRGLSLADRAVLQALLIDLGKDSTRALAEKVLTAVDLDALPLDVKARLAVVAEDDGLMLSLVPKAVADLAALGANAAAVELNQALLERVEGERLRNTLLSQAKLRDSMGAHEEAFALVKRVLDDRSASPSQRFDAAMIASRTLRALARFDDVIEVLSWATDSKDKKARARVQRELAKVYLRIGNYEATAKAARDGIESAPENDLVRVDLLTTLGVVSSYQGDHLAARQRYQEALALARQAGSKLDEANALTCLAVGYYHASEYRKAGELFEQSLEIARELGDIGSMANFSVNLGATHFYLGEPARAAEHYETAAKLARRAGRVSTDVQARNNLALLHIYFGLYERARVELAEVMHDAESAGLKYLAAQATGALGDLASRLGDVETALNNYNKAVQRYLELGQNREVAEAHLDAAEALLNRNAAGDASVAAARLATARDYIDREKLEDFQLRLKLLSARARLATGDAKEAIRQLDEVLQKARQVEDREVEWNVLTASAVAHEMQGAEFMARRYDRMAVEVLEQLALGVPREHREAFWHDPRRREARRRAALAGESSHRSSSSIDSHVTARDAKNERLLEIIKRLASEHDLDRLLERITESAVELSRAERGFVLLVDESGKLETRTVRAKNPASEEPHLAFSRSIAEAVLIDGEPIITVDATDDRRLDQYLSVHQLMLRSVACLPVRGHSGTVGVLYLEHRRRRGRFSEADIDLLFAFADQAAIAIENARLISENEWKRQELARVNLELDKARKGMEELLIARTEELEEARRELSRARLESYEGWFRFNMIGRSAAMQSIFKVIDRLRNTSVPVVIQGESGTGKELVARAIHYEGPNAKAPFISLSCSSIPETLLESELFGHVKGAFSGADRDRPGMIVRASGGTLFMDEVGDMPLKMQVDLLRVIQEGTVRPVGSDRDERVNIRFIASSNKPLKELVNAKLFRQDLYYRLNVVEVNLPSLRERREDIPILCDHFLRSFAKRENKPIKGISPEALQKLSNHPLPGNVRQLEHVLLNAWILVEGNAIGADDLALDGGEFEANKPIKNGLSRATNTMRKNNATGESMASKPGNGVRYELYKNDEKRRILEALEANGWNKLKTAKELGMARRTFYRRLRDHRII
ncbi:MAG: sigma 54-interacting transcriptional regulator [Deltaproteobacteria bacterium]|nr:sigma 54-interacting transcriptional regulator [Deltaproteobacteria bacterium]